MENNANAEAKTEIKNDNKAETVTKSLEPKPEPKKEEVKKSETPKVEIPKVAALTFPREFSKKVFIRRKEKMASLPGLNPDDARLKIGSSYKGPSVARGLTPKEEQRFFPSMLGVSFESQNWEKVSSDYWKNISKEVPSGTGLELEVGLKYNTEEDYLYDQKLFLNNDGIIVEPKGTPINLNDYILWRYCLIYHAVANDISKAYDSPKIDFYMFNKDKETKDKKAILVQKQKAFTLLMSNIGDREWVDCILRVLVAEDKQSKVYLKDLNDMSIDEKDIILEEYQNKSPDKFLTIGNDKDLVLRSFIEQAIAMGVLNRIPNTTAITLEGQTIGNTISQTIEFLNSPKNSNELSILKAKTRTIPS